MAIDIIAVYTDRNGKEDGEVSHFQAFANGSSGTVGLGNIAGVGAALADRPLATFWMILWSSGMASKFCE